LEQSPFTPIELPPGLPPPGEVTPNSRNMLGHLHHARRMWREWTELGGDPFVNSPPRYTAEAYDLADLMALFGLDGPSRHLDMLAPIGSQLGPVWFIWYHYFFSSHERVLRLCELIALMNALGAKVPDDPTWWEEYSEVLLLPFLTEFHTQGGLATVIEMLEDAGSHFSLPFGSYLGDFVSVAVIVPAGTHSFTPTGPMVMSPLNMTDDQFEPPLFVGYGSKTFAQTQTADESALTPWQIPLIQIASNEEIKREGLHPLAFVALGTNNTYPTPGFKPLPRNPIYPDVCDVLEVSDDETIPNTGEHKKRHMTLISLAKILAGGSLGPLGVILGAAASLFEALEDTNPDPDDFPLPEEGQDVLPESLDTGFIIRSEEVRDDFGDSNESFSYWPDNTASMTVNSAAPPDWFNQPALRFGVPCLNDPFRHRSGKPWPDFRPVTILALAGKLGQG
jgi:hypothetical protein